MSAGGKKRKVEQGASGRLTDGDSKAAAKKAKGGAGGAANGTTTNKKRTGSKTTVAPLPKPKTPWEPEKEEKLTEAEIAEFEEKAEEWRKEQQEAAETPVDVPPPPAPYARPFEIEQIATDPKLGMLF